MLNDIIWPPTRTYKTNGQHEPIQFYTDCLNNSNEFYILLGYFSSSAINVLANGFASFIAKGGMVKMVINDALQDSDVDTIARAYDESVPLPIFNLNDFAGLVKLLNKRNEHFFECLAYLIREKRIEIVAIKPRSSTGISHFKKGYFFDGTNSIGFKGSCNFTANALLANLEDVTAIIPEDGEILRAQFEEVKNDFYRYFNREEDVIYIDPSIVEKNILENFKGKNIQELIDDEKFINTELEKRSQVKPTIKTLSELKSRLTVELKEPSLQNVELRDYQMEAYNAWVKNDYHGIFAMATGTGKTITALNCVLQEYLKSQEKKYRVLILVPSRFLVDQWGKEVQGFGFSRIICVSSKISGWRKALDYTLCTTKEIDSSYVIISTYKSFTTNFFQTQLKRLPADTILIADEAHNIASKNVENKLSSLKHLTRKIALSATPKRIYDPEGTEKMEAFFDDCEPYTYRFSMSRAISEGYLSQYYYYPHIVELTKPELEEYTELSTQIARIFSLSKKDPKYLDLYNKLLLKRKRIIHMAENKLESSIKILRKIYSERNNLTYSLVFVPEGFQTTKNLLEDDWGLNDQFDDEVELIRLISLYSAEIAKINNGIAVNKIVSGDKDRDKKLKQFADGHIDVLTAMKCLDEGVDIPKAKTAIFCSSTGNPRQYIQRRGRVLRNYKNQTAEIHDLIVVPLISKTANGTYEVEKNLVSGELKRVAYFAKLSLDYPYSEEALKEVCDYYGLSIYTLAKELEEQ